MDSKDAYSYLTPSMMAVAIELFGWDHFQFTAAEQKQMNVHTLDAMFKSYYQIQNMELRTITRPGGPVDGTPLIKRAAFAMFIGMHMIADPVRFNYHALSTTDINM
jgi:hypothetical protein